MRALKVPEHTGATPAYEPVQTRCRKTCGETLNVMSCGGIQMTSPILFSFAVVRSFLFIQCVIYNVFMPERAPRVKPMPQNISEVYSQLGIADNASLDDVRSAQKKFYKKYHPDIVTDKNKKEKASEILKRVNRAVELLSDRGERGRFERGQVDFWGGNITAQPQPQKRYEAAPRSQEPPRTRTRENLDAKVLNALNKLNVEYRKFIADVEEVKKYPSINLSQKQESENLAHLFGFATTFLSGLDSPLMAQASPATAAIVDTLKRQMLGTFNALVIEMNRNYSALPPYSVLEAYVLFMKEVRSLKNNSYAAIYSVGIESRMFDSFESGIQRAKFKKDLRDVEIYLKRILQTASTDTHRLQAFYRKCEETLTQRLKEMWV